MSPSCTPPVPSYLNRLVPSPPVTGESNSDWLVLTTTNSGALAGGSPK